MTQIRLVQVLVDVEHEYPKNQSEETYSDYPLLKVDNAFALLGPENRCEY